MAGRRPKNSKARKAALRTVVLATGEAVIINEFANAVKPPTIVSVGLLGVLLIIKMYRNDDDSNTPQKPSSASTSDEPDLTPPPESPAEITQPLPKISETSRPIPIWGVIPGFKQLLKDAAEWLVSDEAVVYAVYLVGVVFFLCAFLAR